jgi:hypothetical protein
VSDVIRTEVVQAVVKDMMAAAGAHPDVSVNEAASAIFTAAARAVEVIKEMGGNMAPIVAALEAMLEHAKREEPGAVRVPLAPGSRWMH